MLTGTSKVTLDVPRDRVGTFDPMTLRTPSGEATDWTIQDRPLPSLAPFADRLVTEAVAFRHDTGRLSGTGNFSPYSRRLRAGDAGHHMPAAIPTHCQRR